MITETTVNLTYLNIVIISDIFTNKMNLCIEIARNEK